MRVGKKQWKHLSILGYSRTLEDSGSTNMKLYYRYYRTAFSCYDTVFGNVTLYYERKIEKG
jgi:hypothetical protein